LGGTKGGKVMSVYVILTIVFAILLPVFIIRREVYDKKASVVGIVFCAAFYGAFATIACYEEEPTALDVYRGKTTLEITYRDSVAIDSTVVYKVK
jgi:succinate-acetate transporter protein